MSARMASLKLPFTVQDVDRYGTRRWYVRVNTGAGKYRKLPIKSLPGTPEFMTEYHAHLCTLRGADHIPAYKQKNDSLGWLIDQYFRSGEFYDLAPATQQDRKSTLNRVALKSGKARYLDIQRGDIILGRDARRDTPAAANKFVIHMKCLFDWAIDRGLADLNPAKDVRHLKKARQGGHHTWTPEQITAFRAAHAVGTTARMAFELHCASLRASDVVRIGRQNIRGRSLDFEQVKTKERAVLPIHDYLMACIDAAPRDTLHLIMTSFGKPFSAKGYCARFRAWCNAAGLPNVCTSHGIRKALAVELAERGASELEIGAALGQRGTQSVKHYTVGADRERLAEAAGRRRK